MSKYAGFNSVLLTKPQKSEFDLSHQKRITARMGRLFPVFITECVPSDVFRGSTEILLRLAPLLAPIYDSLQLYVHFFFVPNRLLWEDWEKFITGGRLGVGIDPAVAPVPPYVDIGALMLAVPAFFDKGNIPDYLGVTPLNAIDPIPANWNNINLDMMPFMAWSRCWYDYYRDRNFVNDDVLTFPYPSGALTTSQASSLMTNRTRNYSHDYFTSALPFTQRGEEVLMPLAGSGSVSYLAESIVKRTDGANSVAGDLNVAGGLAEPFLRETGNFNARIENIDEVTMDASSVSINDFRSAYALQVWLERNAIGGSRYNESTQAHFGVRPQDSRLQRAEYIGGGRIPIKISEVVSTAYSQEGGGDTVPLANMAGHGVTYGDTNRFNYFCSEHGFIIGVASVMAPGSYHQGLPRMFRRRTFLDYPWPTFAKLGEQTVDKAELYASPANLTPDADGLLPLFGYQSRYADWKHILNSSHGDFHDTLLFWTLTRNFAISPVLSENFNLFDLSTQDRIFAVNGDEQNLWLYVHNKVSVRRPLPYFGTPNTLGFS